VTLLNAHPKVGLKILMSGGTRCNVTHREVSERDFNAGSRPFVARVLRAFTVEQTLAWFASLGVELRLEDTGKYFPVSDDAQTVLDALLHECERAGVTLRSGARVVRLERERARRNRNARRTRRRARYTYRCKRRSFQSRTQAHRDRSECGPNALQARFSMCAARPRSAARRGARRVEWPPPARARRTARVRRVTASGGLSFPRTAATASATARHQLGHSSCRPCPR
jgi:predicted flavoprotein YhiN